MSRCEITLRSGATVVFDATEVTWARTPGLGHSLKWTTPDVATRALMHVDIGEIAAVLFLED